MRYILFLIILLTSGSAFSQSFYYEKYDRRWILSFGTGFTSYFGELSNSGQFFDTRPNINVGMERKLTSRTSLRTELTWYSIDGSDSDADTQSRRQRNLSFFSHNFEWNFEAMFGLFREGRRYYQRRKVNPYGFFGIGLTYFNPKANYEGETYTLKPYMTEDVDYSRVAFIVPAGIGLKFKVNETWNINLEGGYRFTFTDFLDDVSTVYIDRSEIQDPIRVALIDRSVELNLPPSETGSVRGNSGANDGYAIINIKAEFYLPINDKYKDYNSAPSEKKGKRKKSKKVQGVF